MNRRKSNRRKKAKREREVSKSRNQEPQKRHTGIITVTQGGFGFVPQDSGDIDIFIPPKYINQAMDGDVVEVEELKEERRSRRRQVTDSGSKKGPAGRVIDIVKRKRTKIIGELIHGNRIKPLNKRLPEFNISGSVEDAKCGDWIEVDIPSPSDSQDRYENSSVTYSKKHGEAGTIEADINAVINEYDLEPPYSEDQINRADKIEPSPVNRKDLTSLYCITIDPIDAKDFDDSVSIKAGEKRGEIELGVHIADVSGYVTPGSEWDLEAKRRGFTAYIPGNTLPMLPSSLTRNASLTTGKPSAAHTVIITIEEKTGKVLRSKRMFSSVQIAKRLTFEEVQDAIDGKPPHNWDEELKENISKVVELTKKMREYRKKTEHFLELATTEIRIICDDKTKKILGMKHKEQSEADMLIEECMLAANVAVAKELSMRKIPGLYRIHPEPTPEKVLDFTLFMEQAFGIIPGDLSSRKACNKFLGSLPDDENKPVIIDAFLRSMMRASYLETPALHFGLGKGLYSHFTSPIRRYTDLIVHQQLRNFDAGSPLRKEEEIAKIAIECSAQESNIDSAYYAANDRLKLHYLNDQMMDGSISLLEGVIQKITPAGMVINIAKLGVVGFVPLELLSEEFRKRGAELVAQRSNKSYKCGEFIYVQLAKIDMVRGSAIFKPTRKE